MLVKALEFIGEKTLCLLYSFFESLKFAIMCIFYLFRPQSYNSATFSVLIKQIYFTAVELLPLFLLMAVIFGSIIMGAVISIAINFNLENQIGSIIVTFSVNEFAPLFTALLISLRSSSAINTEIAVMSVHKELNFLKMYKINLFDYLIVPRIISGVISTISLSILFALIMVGGGYLYINFFLGIDFHTYTFLIFNALEISHFVILLVKSLMYGFLIMVIPIYSGLKAKDSYTQIPISVLRGMVAIFVAIFLVEVLSLVVQFI